MSRSSIATTVGAVAAMILGTLSATGCFRTNLRSKAELPAESEVRRERLIVHSNFKIAEHHRLLDELVQLQDDVTGCLDLPEAKSTIHVYLFETPAQYHAYVSERLPHAPERRACFVHRANDNLQVYAHWSDFVAIDLRHEVTHGYLHAVVSDIPLWLDEGIAEYFEVSRDSHGFNLPHRRLLQRHRVEDNWRPEMKKLEELSLPSELGQLHYAESWAWVHFLLETTPERRQILCDYLARLRMTGEAPPLSEAIAESIPNAELLLLKHLRSLQP